MFEELRARIDRGKTFLITTHMNPDGDAVGSSLALQQVLEKLGKDARIVHRDPVPFSLKRLPALERWNVMDHLPEGYPNGWDVTFVVECPRPERTGFSGIRDGFLVNLDHHVSNTRYGDINIVNPEVPCVGMLVWKLAIDEYGLQVFPPITDHLFVALATDTGQFCYANADRECFMMAADLVERGTKPEKISSILYEGYPASAVKLRGLILSTLELHRDGKMALIFFPERFLSEAGADSGDAEGVIDEPRKIDGVEVAILFRELPDGTIKISLRSDGEINVESVASRHGGGGHHNAAGFILDTSMKEAKAFILRELEGAV